MKFNKLTNRLMRALLPASLLIAGSGIPSLHGAGPANLNKLVVLGDSLSAGFQNFSLFDDQSVSGLPPSGQRRGFASLIAAQAGVSLPLPLISFPGIPPTLMLTPTGQVIRASGVGSRSNPTIQTTNLSVPGFALADAISHPFPGTPEVNAIDALSVSVLGYPAIVGVPVAPGCGPIPSPSGLIVSELACAKALNPTTVLVSLGNNDALQALTFGMPPTNPVTFGLNYLKMMSTLASTGATIVVANIPDVSTVPYLLPVPVFEARCHVSTGANADDFVVTDITAPAFDLCVYYAIRPAALIKQAQDAVKAYNFAIATTAKLFGATVVDINGLLADIATNGYKVGSVKLTTAYLGGLFSIDGIHPTNTGYAILANEWINTMNQKNKTKIPLVNVKNVALTDPLVLVKP